MSLFLPLNGLRFSKTANRHTCMTWQPGRRMIQALFERERDEERWYWVSNALYLTWLKSYNPSANSDRNGASQTCSSTCLLGACQVQTRLARSLASPRVRRDRVFVPDFRNTLTLFQNTSNQDIIWGTWASFVAFICGLRLNNAQWAASQRPDWGAVVSARVDEPRYWVNDKLDPLFILINMTFS